ncbi:MAG: cation diffusion facilitator family transporter [Burkholderiaceae bacterium]
MTRPEHPEAAPARPHDDFPGHHAGDADRHPHHHHHHGLHDPARALGWSLVLVLGFGAIEALVGWLSGSLALVSDAAHMLTDAVALGLAWFAQKLSRRDPTESHSFGFGRAETLAAFVNALFYLVLLGSISVEAVGRLYRPHELRPDWALPVAVLGLVVNAVMLWMLRRDGDRLNTRAALLHVAGDFAGSVTAIVAIAAAWATGWTRIDALLALAISVLMLATTLRLLRDSARVLMNAAPESVDVGAAGRALQAIAGVRSVRELHVWSPGGGHAAISAHLAIERIEQWPGVLEEARRTMRERFGVDHLTLQPEAVAANRAGASGAAAPEAVAPEAAAPEAVAPEAVAPEAVAPAPATPDLARRLERAQADRDEALRQALAAEQQRDLAGEAALRFERELDDERRSLARELNEELSAHATAVRSLAATFESRLAQREPSLARLASLMVGNIDAMSAAIRSMVNRVRPQALEGGGLLDGLRALVADWRLRQPQMRFELLVDPPEPAVFGLGLPSVESAAWRIVAEALDNAVVHSGARTVVVSARRGAQALTLQVSDDGQGLPRTARAEGPGMRRMREIAQASGGALSVATGEAGGVEVLVTLPWPGPATS